MRTLSEALLGSLRLKYQFSLHSDINLFLEKINFTCNLTRLAQHFNGTLNDLNLVVCLRSNLESAGLEVLSFNLTAVKNYSC